MTAPNPADFPWESRDKEVEAKITFNLPMRRENQFLSEENFRLKRLLRENGISWSTVAQAHILQTNPLKRKATRATTRARIKAELRVPIEVLLRIVEFSLISDRPVVDPLSKMKPENMTDDEKPDQLHHQLAVGCLATCRTLYIEGRRYLWEGNEFTFTTPEAVGNFAELDFAFRAKIKHVNFRIIAQFWDDERRKYRHKLDRSYHPDLTGHHNLHVAMRPKESPHNRGGFRCYTWSQVTDFLLALRAPYVPKYKSKEPRPALLPALETLRIDLVNFTDTILPISGKDLHDVANHELARTLNELQLTGVPCDEPGMKATAELIGMVKDNGLYLETVPKYAAINKRLKFLSPRSWCGRVVRPVLYSGPVSSPSASHQIPGAAPPAPKEEGYPETTKEEDKKVLWKRVPVSRDSSKRVWTPFNAQTGYKMLDCDSDYETEDDYDHVCPCCGEPHPGAVDFDWEDDFYDYH